MAHCTPTFLKITLLVIPFSSINADVYRRVHVNLDHEKVKANIGLASRVLKELSVICENCNMRDRYKMGEVSKVAANYLWGKARAFSIS